MQDPDWFLTLPQGASRRDDTPSTWESRMPADARSVLADLADGVPLDPAGAALLLDSSGTDLDRLLDLAGSLRDQGLEQRGADRTVTYSRKVFLPLTTLCRDRCHYCVFVDTPGKLRLAGRPPYLSPEQVLATASAGAALGCQEALLTLGDRPEDRWPIAREWLDAHGYASTLDYVAATARLLLEETGMLPHLNPGVMTWQEMQRLRPYAPSMGMMLETTSRDLWSEPGGAHYGSPDKDPAVRLRVLEDAGRSRIPFSTGVLLGIGETLRDRADALFAIRDSHLRWGHIQETIVQNFRTKPGTAMQNSPDLGTRQYVAAVAVARLVMGPQAHLQAPPNLTDPQELHLLIRAGIDDWGGVSPLTPDHVNPERPWPHLDDLAEATRRSGYTLRERLTAHPRYVRDAGEWIDDRIHPHVEALADDRGLAVPGREPSGRPHGIRIAADRRPDTAPDLVAAIARAERSPAMLGDADYALLLTARGRGLDTLTELADQVRRDAVGDTVHYVVNRNLDGSLFGAAGGLDLQEVAAVAADAAARGATELCVQGAPAADLPGEAFWDLIAAAAGAGLHVHAFRPPEILDAARRLGCEPAEFLRRARELGLGSVPGTAARILNDRVRAVLTDGGDPPAAEWIRVIRLAHEVGLRSTATLVHGHVESPEHVVAHLRTLARIQDDTGGFTEVIPMPFVAADHPVLVPGARRSDLAESRAVHAVTRLLLHGRIDHVQAAWPKLGLDGARVLLRSGADDAGGLLLGGGPRPDAGAETGRSLAVSDLRGLAADLGRELRPRTTLYQELP